MKTEELLCNLKEEILSMLNFGGYFFKSAYDELNGRILRRSFGSLLEEFQEHWDEDVTEELLMQALIELDMGAKLCPDIGKFVFTRIDTFRPIPDSFVGSYMGWGYAQNYKTRKTADKYDYTYLQNLYEKVFKLDSTIPCQAVSTLTEDVETT